MDGFPQDEMTVGEQTEIEGAKLRGIPEPAVASTIIIDPRGIIDSTNPAMLKLVQCSLDELIGQNIDILMPEPYRAEHDSYMAGYLRTGEKRIIGTGRGRPG